MFPEGFKIGTRVRMTATSNDPWPIEIGDEGVVSYIVANGRSALVRWASGRSQAILTTDPFEVVAEASPVQIDYRAPQPQRRMVLIGKFYGRETLVQNIAPLAGEPEWEPFANRAALWDWFGEDEPDESGDPDLYRKHEVEDEL